MGEGEAGERGEENSSPPPALSLRGEENSSPPRCVSRAGGERRKRGPPPSYFGQAGERGEENSSPPRCVSRAGGERRKRGPPHPALRLTARERERKKKGGGVSNPFLILISILLINLVFYQFL